MRPHTWFFVATALLAISAACSDEEAATDPSPSIIGVADAGGASDAHVGSDGSGTGSDRDGGASNEGGTITEAGLDAISTADAADADSGQEGFVAIGQPDSHTVLGVIEGMAAPSSVLIVGGKLLVSERGRVRIWNGLPSGPSTRASLVLGQPDEKTNLPNLGGVSASSLNAPMGIWSDGTRLVVADYQNNRVLVWNTFPTTSGQPASFALGQPSLGASAYDANVSGSTMGQPLAVYSDGTRLFVADSGNHRVLVWNTFPTTSGQAADFALGQPSGATNLTSHVGNNGGVSASSLSLPTGIVSIGTKLFVSDAENNRVLVWNTIPTAGGQPADFALGQPAGASNLTSAANNAGGVSGGTLYYPAQMSTDGSRLFLADRMNMRVLVWSSAPTVGGESAAFALGQPGGATNLTSGVRAMLSGATVDAPLGVAVGDGHLAVADSANYRVLVWTTLPTVGGTSANFALGQPAGPSNLATRDELAATVSPTSLKGVVGAMATDGTRVFLADGAHHRVLVWNTMPTSATDPPSFALGQPAGPDNLTAVAVDPPITGASMNFPSAVFVDGTRLYVCDSQNNRVLVWNTIPTAAGQSADFALGVHNLTTRGGADLGLDGVSMVTPHSVLRVGTKLLVSDRLNQRVLVWNTVPTVMGQPADFALGQPAGPSNLTTNAVNSGGISGSSMSYPTDLTSAAGKLFVSDYGNHRVLVWNTIPTSGGQPADFALGQPAGAANLTTNARNSPSRSASSMSSPQAVASDGTSLYVADSDNNRVLVWSSLPTAGGAAANAVIGQADFSLGGANRNQAPSAKTLYGPGGVLVQPSRLFITDSGNDRILIVDRP